MEPSKRPQRSARYLVGVVGTGHQQEDPGEGVLGGVGDLSGFRTWVKIVKVSKCEHDTRVRTGVCVCVYLVGGDSSEQRGWKSCQSGRTAEAN